jgi:hypothetical protein
VRSISGETSSHGTWHSTGDWYGGCNGFDRPFEVVLFEEV